MNVLESLKIKDATVLNVKDGDILIVKLEDKNAARNELEYVYNFIQETLNKRGINDVETVITTNISDIKIIRR